MARHCDRPCCSERGAIAYGFDAERVLVWLAPFDPDADRNRAGVLCVRHADAMVVPVGWTLEDARDPMPRLFKPVGRTSRPARPGRRQPAGPAVRSATKAPTAKRKGAKPPKPKGPTPGPSEQQLTFDDPDTGSDSSRTVVDVTGVASTDDPDATVAIPWMPEFDITDDLGGTLSADTPLLARAFRGIERRI